MRLIALLSLSLATAAPLFAEAPPVDGTLPEDLLPQLRPLLQMAVERSPNTIAASLAVAQQEASKIQTDSILWPSVGLNGSYQSSYEQESTSTQSSSTQGFVYGASVSQPLFQFGALRNQVAIGTLGLKIAERQYADAYRLLAASIREQYLGLVARNIGLRNARFALELTNIQMQAAQAKFDSGASSQAELEDAKLAVEQAQLDSDRAATEMAYSKQVFIRLVGIDSLGDESIPLMVPHPDYQAQKADLILTGFVGEGIESTFQSQVYDMILKQEDLSYKISQCPPAAQVQCERWLLLLRVHLAVGEQHLADRALGRDDGGQRQLDDIRRVRHARGEARCTSVQTARREAEEELRRLDDRHHHLHAPPVGPLGAGDEACRGPRRAYRRRGQALQGGPEPGIRLEGVDRCRHPEPERD